MTNEKDRGMGCEFRAGSAHSGLAAWARLNTGSLSALSWRSLDTLLVSCPASPKNTLVAVLAVPDAAQQPAQPKEMEEPQVERGRRSGRRSLPGDTEVPGRSAAETVVHLHGFVLAALGLHAGAPLALCQAPGGRGADHPPAGMVEMEPLGDEGCEPRQMAGDQCHGLVLRRGWLVILDAGGSCVVGRVTAILAPDGEPLPDGSLACVRAGVTRFSLSPRPGTAPPPSADVLTEKLLHQELQARLGGIAGDPPGSDPSRVQS